MPVCSGCLSPHFRVIAPDLPGFGESTRNTAAHYAIIDQVERIHAFVTSLSLAGFHLGGNSMGGQLAGAYAARYPDQVQSLWLLAPGGVSSAQPSELAERLEKGASRIRKQHGARNFSPLRRTALSLLKQETICKTGIAIQRQNAGWDNDYREKVLSGAAI